MLWLPAGDITSPDVCLNRFNQGMGSNCCGRFHEANNQKTIWESRSPGARTEQEWLSSSQIIGVGWGWNLSELTHLLLGFLDWKRCNKSASYIIIRTLYYTVVHIIQNIHSDSLRIASQSQVPWWPGDLSSAWRADFSFASSMLSVVLPWFSLGSGCCCSGCCCDHWTMMDHSLLVCLEVWVFRRERMI